jgi:predicted nucleotide-binding protein
VSESVVYTKKDVELPSDIYGLVYLPYEQSIRERYRDIIRELKNASYNLRNKLSRTPDL